MAYITPSAHISTRVFAAMAALLWLAAITLAAVTGVGILPPIGYILTGVAAVTALTTLISSQALPSLITSTATERDTDRN